MRRSIFISLILCCLTWVSFVPMSNVSYAQEPASSDSTVGAQVLEGFNAIENSRQTGNQIEIKQRHQILFIMGATLLVLLLCTTYFGVATGIYGKPLFVPHMIFAGLSVTLAIAHSVVAMVWFFPY